MTKDIQPLIQTIVLSGLCRFITYKVFCSVNAAIRSFLYTYILRFNLKFMFSLFHQSVIFVTQHSCHFNSHSGERSFIFSTIPSKYSFNESFSAQCENISKPFSIHFEPRWITIRPCIHPRFYLHLPFQLNYFQVYDCTRFLSPNSQFRLV